MIATFIFDPTFGGGLTSIVVPEVRMAIKMAIKVLPSIMKNKEDKHKRNKK